MATDYYLIGSTYTYEDKSSEDIFDEMRSRNVVCVGYANMDLSHLYRKAHQDIINYLKGMEEKPASYNSLKHFLNLKRGDMVAIKKWNMVAGVGGMKVLAYARVVERNGRVYSYDKGGLAHMVNVEYLDTPADMFPYNYRTTIYHVTELDRIEKIFGSIGMEAAMDRILDEYVDISDLLGSLSSLEEEINPASSIWDDGGRMIEELQRRLRGLVNEINVIPGGNPGGCHNTLVVSIGRHDDVEKRILKAFAHVTAICKGRTKNVVFWAAVFDFMAWKEYRSSFKSVRVTLRPPFGAKVALS